MGEPGSNLWRCCESDVAVELDELCLGLGSEDNVAHHRFLAVAFRCSAANAARTLSTDTARVGSAISASYAGATLSRSQSSTARSRASKVRSPSRITSLSEAYSPLATLARTRSAISLGSVILSCWVERMTLLPIG